MSRRLVLHLGINKTGSSALQVALVRHRAELARHGVCYPSAVSDARARNGSVVSGNGTRLLAHLAPPEPATTEDAEAARDRLATDLSRTDASTIVYSSELLFRFQPDRVEQLADDMDERGITPRAVVYVRDIAGHALSAYAQGVKRSRVRTGLPEFLGTAGEPGRYAPCLRERLEHLVATFGDENVTVLHYDSERVDLVPRFFSTVLGVPGDLARDGVADVVNRSLTPHELELMRYANRRLRSKEAAWKLSDALIAYPPARDSGRLALTREDMAALHERFDDDVAWINDHFFPDGRLTVDGGAQVRADHDGTVEPTPQERHLMDAMVDLVNREVGERRRAAKALSVAVKTTPPVTVKTTPSATAKSSPASIAVAADATVEPRALWRRRETGSRAPPGC